MLTDGIMIKSALIVRVLAVMIMYEIMLHTYSTNKQMAQLLIVQIPYMLDQRPLSNSSLSEL